MGVHCPYGAPLHGFQLRDILVLKAFLFREAKTRITGVGELRGPLLALYVVVRYYSYLNSVCIVLFVYRQYWEAPRKDFRCSNAI